MYVFTRTVYSASICAVCVAVCVAVRVAMCVAVCVCAEHSASTSVHGRLVGGIYIYYIHI